MRPKNRSDVLWLTREIKTLMNRRDFLKKKKFNKFKSQDIVYNEILNEYKKMRNFVVQLIREAKREYYSSLIAKCDKESEKIWNVLSQVITTKISEKKAKKNIIE